MEESPLILSNGSSAEETMENLKNLLGQKLATEKALEAIAAQGNICNDMVKKLKKEFEESKLSTKEGMSFIEVKNHLLLQYLISLSGLVLLKTSGKSIQNTSYLHQLVEVRTFLEKMRPIESKLKYQIEKLVSTAVQGKAAPGADPLKYRANLDDLQKDGEDDDNYNSDEDEDEDDEEISDSEKDKGKSDINKTGVYRPPKVAPTPYDEGPGVNASKKAEHTRKKTLNQTLVRELQEEYLDTPVEIHNMGDAYAKQLSREVRDKQRFEETYMTRLPVTKRDKHRDNAMSTLGVLGDEITDFKQKRGSSQQSSGKKGKKRKFGGKKSKGGHKRFKK